MDRTSYALTVSAFRIGQSDVQIVVAAERDGHPLWKVARFGEVLNRHGAWEYEPLPSARDAAFIERTRFIDPLEALEIYKKQDKERRA